MFQTYNQSHCFGKDILCFLATYSLAYHSTTATQIHHGNSKAKKADTPATTHNVVTMFPCLSKPTVNTIVDRQLDLDNLQLQIIVSCIVYSVHIWKGHHVFSVSQDNENNIATHKFSRFMYWELWWKLQFSRISQGCFRYHMEQSRFSNTNVPIQGMAIKGVMGKIISVLWDALPVVFISFTAFIPIPDYTDNPRHQSWRCIHWLYREGVTRYSAIHPRKLKFVQD